MPTPTHIKDVIARAKASLKKADETIAASDIFLKKLHKEVMQIVEENEKAQRALDKEIIAVAEEMDEATLQFIKDTE